MSIELNWETLTSGPDGAALAERIRSFVHDRFQTVPLPRFIKSVTVHGFDFGTIPPQLNLKDITDPLPDFYDGDLDEDEGDGDDEDDDRQTPTESGDQRRHERRAHAEMLRNDMASPYDLSSPFMGTATPGFLGGPGLNYFHGHLGATGAHTPLAAVAGAHHLGSSWMGSSTAAPDTADLYTPSHSRNPSQSSISVDNFGGSVAGAHSLREKGSVSTLAPTSVNTSSRPPTRDAHFESAIVEEDDEDAAHGAGPHHDEEHGHRREPRVEDVQAVFRIRYDGDVRLQLTAEILLDYPMPSFVGIPLKLNITGLSFDGVGVLAHIRKRVHFCFLSPEDALAAVVPGEEEEKEGERKGRFGGLLQEIKVESEIGERDGGKQSLKNVGKVERFVLEQVRRIFEEELVYPSFWTFLV